MFLDLEEECRLCLVVLSKEGEAGHLGNIHRCRIAWTETCKNSFCEVRTVTIRSNPMTTPPSVRQW